MPKLANGQDQESALGKRLRALRVSRGLSLRSVAAMAQITPGALSLIENGENTPGLGTLRGLVKALGSTMSEFFAAEERQDTHGNGIVFRASELVSIVSGKGLRFLGLPGPASGRVMQLLYESYAPNCGDRGDAPYSHDGEEGGFCIAGTIEIRVGDKREVLGPGDAYYYSSRLPHRWKNIGKVPAVVVSACTPPIL
jgi:transcriptional regulator with XRE-family HTH domain